MFEHVPFLLRQKAAVASPGSATPRAWSPPASEGWLRVDEPHVKHSITRGEDISKVGNSHGIVFDSALMELAHLLPGDEVNVEVHSGGTITLKPLAETSASPPLPR